MLTTRERYDQLEVVGSGGMATVWRARDTILDRIVAMKRPHPAPPGSDIHTRFLRESRIAATVVHPNLVTIYDVGTDDDGPFLIMEYVEAPSLAEIEVSPDDIAPIGAQIAAALAAIHAADIVHRDVKPANVLVGPNGVKLTDFGIARSLRQAMALTQTGVVHATPAYAAPEVLAGADHSAAADVYSLGTLLYELVAGRGLAAHNDTGVMVTDPDWSPILGPALATDPDDRPTAAELSRQLTALQSGKRTSELPKTTRLAVPPASAASPRPGLVVPATMPATLPETTQASAGQLRQPEVHSFPSAPPSRRSVPKSRAVWIFAVLALLIVGFVALAARAADRRNGGPLAGDDSAQPVAPGEAAPGESTDPPTPLEVAQFTFVKFVAGLPDDEISGKKTDRLIEQLDEAIAAAAAGDSDRAADELRDVAKRIDKDIDADASRASALALLADVATALGVDLDADIEATFEADDDADGE